jgi:hypothetical protein
MLRSRIDLDNQQGPARTIYEATPEGRAAWQQAMLTVLATLQPHYDPFQLGLSNLTALDPAATLTALNQRRDSLQQTLTRLRARHTETQPYAPPHVSAMFELSLAQIDAELHWLTTFIDRLRMSQQGDNPHAH